MRSLTSNEIKRYLEDFSLALLKAYPSAKEEIKEKFRNLTIKDVDIEVEEDSNGNLNITLTHAYKHFSKTYTKNNYTRGKDSYIKFKGVAKVKDCIKALDGNFTKSSTQFKFTIKFNSSGIKNEKIIKALKKSSTSLNRKLEIYCRNLEGSYSYDGKEISVAIGEVIDANSLSAHCRVGLVIGLNKYLPNSLDNHTFVNLSRKMRIIS